MASKHDAITKRVIVIGAGPAGLTTLKTLLHFPRSPCRTDDMGRGGGGRGGGGKGSVSSVPAFDPILLEAGGAIGGTFDQRSYENGCLVSSKQLTSFSDYRFPLNHHDHPTMEQYVDYLGRYVNRFGLDSPSGSQWNKTALEKKSRIQLHSKVISVEREGSQHRVTWVVEGDSGKSETYSEVCDALSICTGLHVIPSVPTIKGIPMNLQPQSPSILTNAGLPTTPPAWAIKGQIEWENMKTKTEGGSNPLEKGIRVIHSSQYKKREEFKDRRVLILGIGETSMDLSYEAIKGGAKEVVVCHRGGFLSFPKVLNDFQVFGVKFDGDLPIDGLITNLFETAYVHPWVAASHLRWFISDFVIKRVLWFLTGTTAGCNQWVGGLPPSRLGRAYVFLNKSSRAMPYINRPYKPRHTFLSSVLGTRYIDPPSDAESEKSIDLALWPRCVNEKGEIEFMTSKELPQGDGIRRIEEERMANRIEKVKPDMVVFCTGYRQDWSWLKGEGAYPKNGPRDVDVREICDSTDVSVGWIGFVRPGVGAIPPIAEQQAMLWCLLLQKEIPIPTSPPHYRLLARKTARIQYGVDHSAYMSTLAKDMGAAPDLWELYKKCGLHVTVCYAFGAAFPSFYRLTGPYESEEMREIVTTEIWETITRRGLLGNLFMGVIPMAFYAVVNLSAYLLESFWLLVLQPLFQLLSNVLVHDDNGVNSRMSKKMMSLKDKDELGSFARSEIRIGNGYSVNGMGNGQGTENRKEGVLNGCGNGNGH